MRTVRVNLGQRGYGVEIGSGLLAPTGLPEGAAQAVAGRRMFVASDDTVWPLYGEQVVRALAASGAEIAGSAYITAGESFKNLKSLGMLWDSLTDAELERNDCLVALGGGVVGDVAGFAAATYLRGIDFLQIPTTLLAMVDSSVGGKTAIDHPAGKNLIGAFHQPRAVVADLGTLQTLPRRESMSGMAEVIKAALLGDPELFDLLEAKGPDILADATSLEETIVRAVAFKAQVVAQDEKEGGLRAVLNLGHTLGHAVETSAGYGRFSHGEAVAMGMGFAIRLSQRLGVLGEKVAERIVGLLKAWGYALKVPNVDAELVLGALRHDKKARGGAPRWVLLADIARPLWNQTVPEPIVAALLKEVQENP